MLIEIHAIQSFGPSNLNRDDTGNPKEALFGGVRRARISSQSAKRAMRVSRIFADTIQTPIAIRTRNIVEEVTKRLAKAGVDSDQIKGHVEKFIKLIYLPPKAGKKDKKEGSNKDDSNTILYISQEEIEMIFNHLQVSLRESKDPNNAKFIKEFKESREQRTSAPDIALFGRMLAKSPSLNIDAACQVAHALSTHDVNTEYDYFTAVEDLQPGEESGAGMLGLVAFNSATYYRCARINWEQLVANLGGDTELAIRTVKGFMKAFALVVPSGKQNSFVNQHAPDFLLAAVRPDNDGQSLDNAFERPVRAKGGGYIEPSIQALGEYWETVDKAYRLSDPVVAVLNPRQYDPHSEELTSATQPNLQSWLNVIINALSEEQA